MSISNKKETKFVVFDSSYNFDLDCREFYYYRSSVFEENKFKSIWCFDIEDAFKFDSYESALFCAIQIGGFVEEFN